MQIYPTQQGDQSQALMLPLKNEQVIVHKSDFYALLDDGKEILLSSFEQTTAKRFTEPELQYWKRECYKSMFPQISSRLFNVSIGGIRIDLTITRLPGESVGDLVVGDLLCFRQKELLAKEIN